MATQSIFTTLKTLSIETSVPGQAPKMQPHTLPRELFPTDEQFEDKDRLLKWAEEKGITHAVLQHGVSQFVIKARAAFKACKKGDVWSNAYGQKNIDALEWKVQTRPKAKMNVEEATAKGHLAAGLALAQSMLANSLDVKTIESALLPVYGDDVTAEIIAELE